MYVSEHWDLLADTLASLSREGTVCYFATPRRDVDRDTVFFERLRSNGFGVEDISAEVRETLPPAVASLLRVAATEEPYARSRTALAWTMHGMRVALSVGLWVQGGRFEVCAAHGVAGVHDRRQPVPIRDGAAAAAALEAAAAVARELPSCLE